MWSFYGILKGVVVQGWDIPQCSPWFSYGSLTFPSKVPLEKKRHAKNMTVLNPFETELDHLSKSGIIWKNNARLWKPSLRTQHTLLHLDSIQSIHQINEWWSNWSDIHIGMLHPVTVTRRHEQACCQGDFLKNPSCGLQKNTRSPWFSERAGG